MTSFETVALIVLVILAIAIAVLKSVKNYNDENEANDEEIKGYVFDGIDDIMSTIKVITGRTVEDTKDYVIKETVKKLTTLREESGIKFNLSESTLTELITTVIDNNYADVIDDYVAKCNVCGQDEDDCACEEVESEEACEDTDIVEPTTEEVVEETTTEETTEEIPDEEEAVVEEPFDTLKGKDGEEVEVPAGDLEDEPAEIATEEAPVEETVVEEEQVVEEVVEEGPTEEAIEEPTTEEEIEEAPVEEVIPEEEPETTEVHTTESCSCIECMTKPQIKAWAADHGIFVSSKMLKDDMIAKVKTEYESQTAKE